MEPWLLGQLTLTLGEEPRLSGGAPSDHRSPYRRSGGQKVLGVFVFEGVSPHSQKPLAVAGVVQP